jgi:hypothetical protein
VFTARYALSPYIKQIRFVFKGFTKIYVNCTVTDFVFLLTYLIHLYVTERKAGRVSASRDSLFLNYPFCVPTCFTDIAIMERFSTNAANMTHCLYADAFYCTVNNSLRTVGVSSQIMKSTRSLAKVWSLTQDLLYGTVANLSVCIPSQHRVYFHSQWASECVCSTPLELRNQGSFTVFL